MTPLRLHRLEAWRLEFWPSVAADAVLNVVTGGLKRAGWLPSLHQRRAYLTTVPQVRNCCCSMTCCNVKDAGWN